ncbi:sulfotransferase domain-containing protein [Salinibacter ruber]|uniref:sulfotransferase domain-containing protein n=1 Tax=Salinibacter ruber TaxID=146919 RepID=UPI0021699BE9|nr:sulfotransferase domain-containing protein [Salinibacter ruber]
MHLARYIHTSCKFRDDDFLVCSFPRSGRTWVRFFICYYIISLYELDVTLTWNNFDQVAPGPLCTSNEKGGMKEYVFDIPRPVFSHRAEFSKYIEEKRVAYIARKFEDIIISKYYWEQHHGSRRVKNVTLDNFISKEFKWKKAIHRLKSFSAALENTSECQIVSFEELKSNTYDTFGKIIKVSPYQYDRDTLTKSIERSQYDNLHRKERKEKDIDNKAAYHTRQGNKGAASDELSRSMRIMINRVIKNEVPSPLCKYYINDKFV